VRLVNLQEILDSLDIFRRITGIRLEDIYNLVLKKGWTFGSAQLLVAMHALIRLYHPAQVRLLHEFWVGETPEMVVSLVPNFNRAMWQALQAVNPRIPFVTVITDLADYPAHFWIDVEAERARLGLDPHLPTGLVLFRGEGSSATTGIARARDSTGCASKAKTSLPPRTKPLRRTG